MKFEVEVMMLVSVEEKVVFEAAGWDVDVIERVRVVRVVWPMLDGRWDNRATMTTAQSRRVGLRLVTCAKTP